MQAWSISSKWVVSNHQGVVDPGELERSVLDLILQLWIGFKDISVSVVGEDDSLLFVGIPDDHLVIVSKILNKEEDLCLFKSREDCLVLRICMIPFASGQEDCHLKKLSKPKSMELSLILLSQT